MGMRQNVELSYSEGKPIYIYSHWDGEEDVNDSPLAHKVRTALNRHERWDDESYLARIIVSEVIRDGLDDETGYGIAPYVGEEEFPTIQVDLKGKTVNGIAFEEFVTMYD